MGKKPIKSHPVFRCSRDPWRLHGLRLIEEDSLGRWWFLPGGQKKGIRKRRTTWKSTKLQVKHCNLKMNIFIQNSRWNEQYPFFYTKHAFFLKCPPTKKGQQHPNSSQRVHVFGWNPVVNHLKGRSTNPAVSGSSPANLPRLGCNTSLSFVYIEPGWIKKTAFLAAKNGRIPSCQDGSVFP